MKFMGKMRFIRTFAVMGLLWSTSRLARAGEPRVELPGGAVNADTSMVIWVDVESATPQVLQQTRAAIEAVIPPDAAKDGIEGWAKVDEFQKVFTNAGGRGLAFIPHHKAVAASQPGEAPASAPAAKDDGLVLIHLKPGTNADAFAAAMREYMTKEMKEAHQPITPENDPAKLGLTPLAGDWVYATGPNLIAPYAVPAGKDEALAAYNESLNRNPGAAIRLAVRMTDAMRLDLKAKSLESVGTFMMFFGNILQALPALQDANAGVVLGEKPRIAVNMHFPDAESAATFKKSLDGIVTFIAMISQMGGAGEDPAAKAKSEALRTALAPLLMDQKGSDLTTSIDTSFVKKLVDLQTAPPAASQPATKPE